MLRRAEEKAGQNECSNIQFIEGGIGEGLLPKSRFDRALLVAVLGEVLEKEAALSEIFAALRPGGILSITEALPDPHYQAFGKVQKMALSAGFTAGDHWRNGLAYTAHFKKPGDPNPS